MTNQALIGLHEYHRTGAQPDQVTRRITGSWSDFEGTRASTEAATLLEGLIDLLGIVRPPGVVTSRVRSE
jgi:hypothetical protein